MTGIITVTSFYSCCLTHLSLLVQMPGSSQHPWNGKSPAQWRSWHRGSLWVPDNSAQSLPQAILLPRWVISRTLHPWTLPRCRRQLEVTEKSTVNVMCAQRPSHLTCLTLRWEEGLQHLHLSYHLAPTLWQIREKHLTQKTRRGWCTSGLRQILKERKGTTQGMVER